MSPKSIPLLLVLLSFIATPASGLPATDSSGDVTLNPVGTAIDLPNLDLLQLTATETQEYLQFHLAVSELEGAGERPIAGSSIYEIYYSIQSAQYRAVATRTVPLTFPPTVNYDATLEQLDASSNTFQDSQALLIVVPDEPAGTITVQIPWTALINQLEIPINPNEDLTKIYVESKSSTAQMNNALQGIEAIPYGEDRMPNSGHGTYKVERRGQLNSAHLLESVSPIRSSNGAASTFLYPLTATSFQDTLATIEPISIPKGWQINPVDEILELKAGIPTHTSVIIQTTMAHQHGGQEMATLALNIAGTQVETIEIGILYTKTPQPTAHHNSLYLHAYTPEDANPTIQPLGYDSNLFTMNTTMAEDFVDAGMEKTLTDGARGWRAPLYPMLGVGLHFTGGQGQLQAILSPTAERELQNIKLTAKIIIEPTEIVVLEGSTTIDSITTVTEYAIELLPKSGEMRYEYDPTQNLAIQIEVDYEFAEPGGITQLKLLSGSYLDLPLLEYQDIPRAAEKSIFISAPANLQPVNPGESRAIPLTIESANQTQINLGVVGLPLDWTSEWNYEQLTVNGETTAYLLVTAPKTAVHGSLAPFYLKATPENGPASVTPIQIRVNAEQDYPDDVLPANEAEGTPPIATAIVAVALLSCAYSQRKR
jgi:hypothetical protein